MTHASLFSGIGGPEVAAAMLGWENAFHCEINPFGRAVLEYWFPNSVSYEDITKTDFTPWRGRIDVLTGGFPCQLFPMLESEAATKMTATSGRRCSALLTKSGPLGSAVRMLLESQLWSKPGYSLTWEAVPLYSRRVTSFTDTNSTSPLPSNESAEIWNVQDIPSSRCLFRLRLAERPTDATESSSSPMMQTPTAVMTCETPERMRERAQRKGYKNGTKYGSLESQVNYDPRFRDMLPTPQAMDCTEVRSKMGREDVLVQTDGGIRRVLKTGSDFGVSLGFLGVNGLLPTPCAHDPKGKTNPGKVKEGSGCVYGETLPDTIDRICSPATAGHPFRLSPLFTQEMMGFPFGWTEYPFLSQDGAPKPSKHTETPSSPRLCTESSKP